jgi:tetratricopeptide (TPR) repeat protein
MRRTISSLIFLALAALPASAAKLQLKDGTTVDCKVQSYDTATKTLHVKLPDGRDQAYRMDDLNARSVYLVNASLIPKDDAKAQLLAANFARDAGLYAHAARRYGEAAKLDPSLKATVDAEMTKLRRSAAELCAANARAAAAKGEYSEAEKWCKTLIEKLPNEPEAAEAKTALDNYYTQTREKKMAAADQKADAALQKDVEKGKQRYSQMVEKSKQALQANSNSQAEGLFRGALADGNAVMRMIDDIEKKYTDPKVKEQASGYRNVVTQQMVEVHLNIASQLATRSDYQGAQKEVNQALALDPKNETAISMRARIEDYSSRGIGWGWR